MNKPLLSIVVPTKDRYKYLKHLIRLIDSFDTPEIELVIQDNTLNNEEIEEFLKNFTSQNICYFHEKKPLSVSENSDLAVLHSSGDFVCFIGDDDGVTSHILDCVKWMSANKIEVLVPSIVGYRWPDYFNGLSGNIAGTCSYKFFTKKVRYKDSQKTLTDIMERGFINRGELPLLYHGIARRDILNKIYQVGNTFFPGSSPDIANGVALSLITKKFVVLDFPIIISGASAHHGGGVKKMKNRAAPIENLPFLPKNAKERWEKNIPKVWAGETVWPESAIKALRYMGREDLIKMVNFEYLLATFIAFHFPLRKLALPLSNDKVKLWKYFFQISSARYFNALKRLIWIKIFNSSDGKILVRKINNIKSAADLMTKLHPTFTLNGDIKNGEI